MRIDFSAPRARALFSFIVVSICAALIYLNGKSFIAAALSSTSTPKLWEAAARLEPNDAAYLEKLGLDREWNMEHRDLAAAERYFQRASQLDPLSARFELELASIEETRGEISMASQAYVVVDKDSPMSADVAWRYGSFLLRQGDTKAGFSEIRRALENDPSLETSALAECLRTSADTTAIVDDALPQKAEAYLAALDYFVWKKRTDAAQIVWTRLLRLGQPFAMPRILPLVDELMDEGRISEAKQVWDQALLASRWPVDAMNSESLIFNSGFENNVLNGGFDWREQPADGVTFLVDNKIAHSGKRSLGIDFSDDSDIHFQNVHQYVVVQAGRRYRFGAFVRTSDITASNGIQFEILDPRHPAELRTLTPKLAGTNPWTRVEVELKTRADTNMIEIILRCSPDDAFYNKLRGTVWIDDVELTLIPGG